MNDPLIGPIERFLARLNGPMNVRFIVQPVMAMLLGARDGVHDAREGEPPFLWNVCMHAETRREQCKACLKRLAIPLIVATVIDAIVQYMLFQRIRFLGAMFMGVLVMGVPYLLAREVANRVVSAHRPTLRPSRGGA